MFEIVAYEGRRRIRGTIALVVALGLFAALYIGLFPSVSAGFDFEQYAESLPPAIRNAFGITALGTIEGYLSTQLYRFVWTILLGLYFAYAAGSLIAGDIERDRLELLLATPVSRARVVVEKFCALLVPLLGLSAAAPVMVYAMTVLIDDPVPLADLVTVTLLAIPYLLACAAVGLLLSVLVSRADLAQRGAMAVVFGLFTLDSVVADTDVEWLGRVSPTHYFDPSAVLVEGEVPLADPLVLLAATAALLALSALWFRRRDVP
ncbi:ABC transporter permease [Halomarina halobia]|uniref:ABC transporter permease n=1 Tax=Halomarina halobia TaxID=3033386 RepID=A0ABD6A942_9EURY|nr:ABC transporter permease subunit [Halomarina sp. PSR21]